MPRSLAWPSIAHAYADFLNACSTAGGSNEEVVLRLLGTHGDASATTMFEHLGDKGAGTFAEAFIACAQPSGQRTTERKRLARDGSGRTVSTTTTSNRYSWATFDLRALQDCATELRALQLPEWVYAAQADAASEEWARGMAELLDGYRDAEQAAWYQRATEPLVAWDAETLAEAMADDDEIDVTDDMIEESRPLLTVLPPWVWRDSDGNPMEEAA